MHQPMSTEIAFHPPEMGRISGEFVVWRNGNIVFACDTFRQAENYCADNALTPDIIDVPEELQV